MKMTRDMLENLLSILPYGLKANSLLTMEILKKNNGKNYDFNSMQLTHICKTPNFNICSFFFLIQQQIHFVFAQLATVTDFRKNASLTRPYTI